MSFIMREYPADGSWGPRTEAEAVLASGEVDENGFLTGGPVSEADWRDWRDKLDRLGQIGRFVMKGFEP